MKKYVILKKDGEEYKLREGDTLKLQFDFEVPRSTINHVVYLDVVLIKEG